VSPDAPHILYMITFHTFTILEHSVLEILMALKLILMILMTLSYLLNLRDVNLLGPVSARRMPPLKN